MYTNPLLPLCVSSTVMRKRTSLLAGSILDLISDYDLDPGRGICMMPNQQVSESEACSSPTAALHADAYKET